MTKRHCTLTGCATCSSDEPLRQAHRALARAGMHQARWGLARAGLLRRVRHRLLPDQIAGAFTALERTPRCDSPQAHDQVTQATSHLGRLLHRLSRVTADPRSGEPAREMRGLAQLMHSTQASAVTRTAQLASMDDARALWLIDHAAHGTIPAAEADRAARHLLDGGGADPVRALVEVLVAGTRPPQTLDAGVTLLRQAVGQYAFEGRCRLLLHAVCAERLDVDAARGLGGRLAVLDDAALRTALVMVADWHGTVATLLDTASTLAAGRSVPT